MAPNDLKLTFNAIRSNVHIYSVLVVPSPNFHSVSLCELAISNISAVFYFTINRNIKFQSFSNFLTSNFKIPLSLVTAIYHLVENKIIRVEERILKNIFGANYKSAEGPKMIHVECYEVKDTPYLFH